MTKFLVHKAAYNKIRNDGTTEGRTTTTWLPVADNREN